MGLECRDSPAAGLATAWSIGRMTPRPAIGNAAGFPISQLGNRLAGSTVSVCDRFYLQQPGTRAQPRYREDHDRHARSDKDEHAIGAKLAQEVRNKERRQNPAKSAPRVNEPD